MQRHANGHNQTGTSQLKEEYINTPSNTLCWSAETRYASLFVVITTQAFNLCNTKCISQKELQLY